MRVRLWALLGEARSVGFELAIPHIAVLSLLLLESAEMRCAGAVFGPSPLSRRLSVHDSMRL
jgi:hypothetical protein